MIQVGPTTRDACNNIAPVFDGRLLGDIPVLTSLRQGNETDSKCTPRQSPPVVVQSKHDHDFIWNP